MKIAVCGTIASGKSEACKFISRRYPVLNCDDVAKRCYDRKHVAYPNIIQLLGRDVLNDNEINLNKVASIIFSDDKIRKKLEEIIHPYVKEQILELHDIVNFIEIAILFECGWEDLFDKIILITCDKDIAIKRMMLNRGYSYDQAILRYNAQLDPQIQIAKADYVIYNNNSLKELEFEVDKMLERIIK